MHHLRNFGLSEPAYDNKAYTFSATYQDGTLTLFAHHVTAPHPDSPRGFPGYWMTIIGGYDLSSLVAAATAKGLGEACGRLSVEQFEEDTDLSDEEGDE
ncbi:hypothetical protein DL770_003794 [Monosporascus sp. CRB-9-2]|nr:hypothetical protein DL770_003794 [Monosporascus sp. CRB-9-2]